MTPLPFIRYFVVCEAFSFEANRKISLLRLLSTIRSPSLALFPLTFPTLCAYALLSECRGRGSFRIEIHQAATGQTVYSTKTYDHDFGNDPLHLFGLPFRIHNCVFPEPGLYTVEFWYNNGVLAEYPLLLE
jgi:hypothetical protein